MLTRHSSQTQSNGRDEPCQMLGLIMRGTFVVVYLMLCAGAHAQEIDLHGPARPGCDVKWYTLHRPDSEYQSYLLSCMNSSQGQPVVPDMGTPGAGTSPPVSGF